MTAGARVHCAQTSRNNFGIVEHEQIAWAQVIEQVGKFAMLDLSSPAFEYEEARLIARGCRMLREEFVWKFVVEVTGAHAGRVAWRVGAWKRGSVGREGAEITSGSRRGNRPKKGL